jgi:hypothetical protein
MKSAFTIKLSLLLLSAVFLLQGGCATQNKTQTQTQILEQEKTEDILVERLNAYNDDVHTIDARALVVYKENDKTFSFRSRIVVEQNGEYLRLDLSDFVFKRPVLTMIKERDEVIAILHTKKAYYRMPYEAFDPARISGVNLDGEMLITTLMGKVFLDRESSSYRSPEPRILDVENASFTQSIRFDDRLLPVHVEYDFRGDRYVLSLEKFMESDGVHFPQSISLQHSARLLEASFSEVHINGAVNVDPALYRIDGLDLGGMERVYL